MVLVLIDFLSLPRSRYAVEVAVVFSNKNLTRYFQEFPFKIQTLKEPNGTVIGFSNFQKGKISKF